MSDLPTRGELRRSRARARRRRNGAVLGVMVVALVLITVGTWKLVLPLFEPEPPETITDYPGPGGEVVAVVIDSTEPDEIAQTLVGVDVVATAQAFVDAYEDNPDAESIGPGTYRLAQQMRAADAVTALLDPANRADRSLTIPPGWTAEQITAKVAEVMGVSVAEVDDAVDELELPDGASEPIEGWLYADVYTVDPDDSVRQVLQRMVDQTVAILDDHGVDAADRESVLIEASIVQAEVSDTEDQGKVARVLSNRLQGCADVGRLLQMNSTVAYGLDKSVTDLTLADLADDSTPYNTYVFEGLPPTPINSPGATALEAVLDPPAGSWCYFVTVNLETGETVFTDDPVEHEQNKAEYREWLQGWREEQSASAEDEEG